MTTPADAAWEALAEELRRDYGNVSTRLLLARHRPLIEAALTPPPAEPTLRDAARALRERLTIDPGNVVSWAEWDTLDEALAKLDPKP